MRRSLRAAEIILLLLLLIFPVLFHSFQSTLNPFAKILPSVDSSAYMYMGNTMRHGMVPYLDTFDQKGPFLYLINYLGLSLCGYQGVWLFEVIALSFAVVFAFLLASKFSNRIVAAAGTAVLFLYLHVFFESGNFTEEYSLPFIFASYYLFSFYFDSSKYCLSRISLFLSGLCFGLVFMLRPNLIALWLIFCSYILIHSLLRKDYKFVLRCIVFFGLGAAVAILPFIIYLDVNNAIPSFIDQYFLYNFRYSSNSFMTKIKTMIAFAKNPFSLISLAVYYIALFHSKKAEHRNILCISFIYYIAAHFLASLSGRVYGHYGMVLLPSYIIPLVYVMNMVYVQYFESNTLKKAGQFLKVPIMATVCAILCFGSIYDGLGTLRQVNAPAKGKDPEVDKVVSIIHEYSSPDDKISVSGYDCIIYLEADRLSSSIYAYQYPIGMVCPCIMDAYAKDLKDNPPKLIVSPKSYDLSAVVPEYSENSNDSPFVLIGATARYNVYLRSQ